MKIVALDLGGYIRHNYIGTYISIDLNAKSFANGGNDIFGIDGDIWPNEDGNDNIPIVRVL